jgi:hypothetical protein
VYSDSALTNPLLTYNFIGAIPPVGVGDVFEINAASGVIGIYTGISCP